MRRVAAKLPGGLLGEVVAHRSYQRLNPHTGRKETWGDALARVTRGLGWLLTHGASSSNHDPELLHDIHTRMAQCKILPPGRGLAAMGSAPVQERELYAALYNCGFQSTDGISVNPASPFCDALHYQLLGVGIGFDTLGAGQCKPPPPSRSGGPVFHVADSVEGWVGSVRALIEARCRGRPAPRFNYDAVRPPGSPVKRFGGSAAGAAPLRELHAALDGVWTRCGRERRALGSVDIVDAMNHMGAFVNRVSARSSAQIALGAVDDAEFRALKDYARNPHRAGYGWASNNSVVVRDGDRVDWGAIAQGVVRNGEPGVFWLDRARRWGRVADRIARHADPLVVGTNPCGEISLEHGELCCLAEVFLDRQTGLEDFVASALAAYRYAKITSLAASHIGLTAEVQTRNRRLGVSLAGVAPFVEAHGLAVLAHWCDVAYAALHREDQRFSASLGVARSIKLTCIKPGGSVPLLAGSTPGMHWPVARHYIRRVRLRHTDPLVRALDAAGVPLEPSDVDPGGQVVAEIPVSHGERVRCVDQVPLEEQIRLAETLQAHWADNQVSVTVSVPRCEETVAGALAQRTSRLKSIAMLPLISPGELLGAYRQLPIEPITLEEYRRRRGALSPIDWGSVDQHRDAQSLPRGCDSDQCTIE